MDDKHERTSGNTSVGLHSGIFTYSIPDTELAHGTSLGNAHAWATSKGTGAIQGLFSTEVGQEVTGSLVVNFFATYRDLIHYSRMEESDRRIGAETIVRLAGVGPGMFTIHPAYQEHSYDLVGQIHVVETFFLPNTGFDDEAAVIKVVEVENPSDREQALSAIACLYLPGSTEHDVEARYEDGLGAIIAWNAGRNNWVRAFGALPHPDAYLVTHDIEEAWNPRYPLANTTAEKGETVASLQKTVFLRPGDRQRMAFVVAFTPNGEREIGRIYRGVTDYEKLLKQTISRYRNVLGQADVMTPDTLINQGVQWCKANMLRVLANYPQGIAFTNDPGKSSHVVVRDAAWFAFGSDYILPEASCDLLEQMAKQQKDSGLIVEYYNALTGETNDYGLNINDNTPLFILAAAHHIETTGHRGCADGLYLPMVNAAQYIISQEDDRGLVYCSADGTGVYGIAGWRNIIEDRSINGAVTEINSECYAALAAVSRICRLRGEEDKAKFFREKADALRTAINEHLKNPNNGMYYLNIDTHGNPITEVTADEVFPMIFGVSDEDTSRLITLRLSNPEFMTSAGLRTSSSLNPVYNPDTFVGLQGGVWPGVTWWYAMASVQSDPSLMVDSLKKSYRQYIENPSIYNTVPGQFSEWFDGESLVNRGMRLSPWEPPRFLWAMIEGAVGLTIVDRNVDIRPRIPYDWRWLRVRNLKTTAGTIDFFAARHQDKLRFYTTSKFLNREDAEIFDTDLTDLLDPVTADAVQSAFGRNGNIVACFGNTSSDKKPAPFSAKRLLDNARRYGVKLYQSEIGEWIDLGAHSGGNLGRLSVDIAPYGFVLFRFGE